MNAPSWLAALRPADLMSAAAALNPDAAPVWTSPRHPAVDTIVPTIEGATR